MSGPLLIHRQPPVAHPISARWPRRLRAKRMTARDGYIRPGGGSPEVPSPGPCSDWPSPA
jgi:hypothetical protein